LNNARSPTHTHTHTLQGCELVQVALLRDRESDSETQRHCEQSLCLTPTHSFTHAITKPLQWHRSRDSSYSANFSRLCEKHKKRPLSSLFRSGLWESTAELI